MIEMWDELFGELAGRSLGELGGEARWELMHRSLEPVWELVAASLAPGGFACVNIGDATRTVDGQFRLFDNHGPVAAYLRQLGLSQLPSILWRKPTNSPSKFLGSGMLPAGAYVTLEHEVILVFRKGGKRSFVSAEDRERRRRSAIFWHERNRWYSDVWTIAGARQGRRAPDAVGRAPVAPDRASDAVGRGGDAVGRARSGAFPLELAYRLVNMFSLQEDLVFDPFLGTGTTSFAAMAAGRSSIGIERDPDLPQAPLAHLGNPEAPAAFAPGLIDRLASFPRSRLAEQRERAGEIEERSSRAHRNDWYAMPVVTAQETSAVLYEPVEESLSKDGARLRLRHQPLG
jgi:DNA modification methylase